MNLMPLKPLYPLPVFSDQEDGRECKTEKASTEAFHTLKSLFTSSLCLNPVSPQLVLEEDKMQMDSLKVREMPEMCVSTSAAGTLDCCTPSYRACLCSNRRRFSCRKSGGFQEIGIPSGSAGKHFSSWG